MHQDICMYNFAWKRRNENKDRQLLSVKMKENKKTIFKVEIWKSNTLYMGDVIALPISE